MTSFAIRSGQMFDGMTAHGPTTVFVKDGRITGVDTTGGVPPDGVHVVALGADAFLLPGLIDCHVHLAFDASADPIGTLAAIDDAQVLAWMRTAAAKAIQAGITTVRDLGDRNYLSLALKAELDQHPEDGPEILPAGPHARRPLPLPGWRGRRRRRPARSGTGTARRGCAIVKIMMSGGNMTPNSVSPYESQYSLDDLRVVVAEADRLGLPVAAHAHAIPAIRDALTAGVRSIEHATFWTADGLHPDPALLAAIADSDTFMSMTVGTAPADGTSFVPMPAMVSRLQRMRETYWTLYKLGAKIVFGTDAGIRPIKPHDVLPYAVAQIPDDGPSPLEALAMATSLAAEACDVSDRKGRIGVSRGVLAARHQPTGRTYGR